MAYELELNADFSGALSGLQTLRDSLVIIKQESNKSATELGNSFKATATSLTAINNRVREAAQAVSGVSTTISGVGIEFQSASGSVDVFKTELESALSASIQLSNKAIEDAQQYVQGSGQKQEALRKEIAELQKVQQMSRAANNPESVKEFTRVIDAQTQKIKQLTNELKGSKKFEITLPDGTVRNVSSLKGLLREAEAEAFALAQKFGYTSEQAIEARKRVAQFRDELNDARAGVDAFNPDKKFQAATQGLSALLGGFTALQGALGFIGVEGENAQRALVKIQSAMAISQGLSQFLNISDALKNIRSVLGLTTIATNVQTAATTANTTATATNTATQGIFRTAVLASTTAVRALTASLLANPFTAAAVAIGAIVTAVIAFGKETKNTKEETEKLIESINKLKDTKLTDAQFRKDLSDLTNRIEEIAAGDDIEKRKKLLRQGFADELTYLNEQEQAYKQTIDNLLADWAKLQTQAMDASEKEREEIKKAQAAIDQEVNAAQEAIDKIIRERAKLVLREKAEFLKLQKEQEAAIKKAAEERKKVIRQTEDDLFKFRQDLQKRAIQSQIESLSGEARIVAERQIAFEEVKEYEKSLKIKQRLAEEANKKISQQRLTQLINIPEALRTDEQVKEIDRLIEGVKLKTKDVAAIGLILNGIENQFSEKLTAFYQEQSELRLQLIESSTQREAETFRLGLDKRVEQLRKAKVSEAEIEALYARETQAFNRKQALTVIDQQEQISVAEVEAIKTGKNEILKTETDKQIAILNIQKFYAEERLKAIEGDTSKEGEVQRAQLKAAISKIESDILSFRKKIGSSPITFADIFNFKGTDEEIAQFNAAMEQIANNVLNITSQLIQSAQAGVQAQLQANQEYINSLNEQINEKQSAIQQEEELNKQGVANNLNARRAELAELKRQKQEALDNEKKIKAEQERLAKLQVISDSAQQASSLAVAAANLIKTFSGMPFGVGLAVAFGLITSMIATFLSFKARMTAASQKLEKGGRLKYGIIKGRSHAQGGIPVGDTGIEVEGQEYITNKKSTEKYLHWLEAINKDDFSNITVSHMTKLPKFNAPALSVSRETIREIQKDKSNAEARIFVQALNTEGIRHDLMRLNSTILDVADDIINKEQVTYLSDGSKVIQRGNTTTIIKPTK